MLCYNLGSNFSGHFCGLRVGTMRCLLMIISSLLVSVPVVAKEVTIHGFVTDIKSPTYFAIDDYKVTREDSLIFDLRTPHGAQHSSFRPEDLRIGTELEVTGEYDEPSGELKAKSIEIFLEDAKTVKRTALLEQMPSLKKDGSGWTGEILADSERLRVLPTTSVTIQANKSERKKLPRHAAPEVSPLESLDVLNLDTFVHYEGTRQANGEIETTKIEFEHAELEPGEAKLWKKAEPDVKAPDYSALVPGEFKMHGCVYEFCTKEIVPSEEAQNYVTKLGESLIPAHQKELPTDDPLKVSFRFYLVKAKSFNAVSYPNGIVLVHSGVFDILQNEAQLSFVLAHEISHVLEKHAWQAHQYHRKELIALKAGGALVPFGGFWVADLAAAGIKNDYARSLENQADRVGLERMFAAGYDIREAPASWKAVSDKKGDGPINPFWSSHDNKAMRRSYLMAELRNRYYDVDFSTLKKDSDEFHHVAEIVKGLEGKGRTKSQ